MAVAEITTTIHEQGRLAKQAFKALANSTASARTGALLHLAKNLHAASADILTANAEDLRACEETGVDEHATERMTLTNQRLQDMCASCEAIAEFEDPLGQVLESRHGDNGLLIQRVSVPLGVIGVVFESRPNVTVDISALCIKSGNAVIMKGGSDAIRTNAVLVDIVKSSMAEAGLPIDAVQFVRNSGRSVVSAMLKMNDYIDLFIPRGSAALVHRVAQEATMPAVTGGVGVCHTFVDADADVNMAVNVVTNAKTQRHTVCNALDTVLVHSAIAPTYIPKMVAALSELGTELRLDRRALSLAGPKRLGTNIKLASDRDYGVEFLAMVASVKVVDSLDEAMAHIERYGSMHSEAIITESAQNAEVFLQQVDAAAVFHNASTRFNDGGELGLGAEVAVSTNKLHARGPMGMRALCSYKWVVRGNGAVRQ